MGKVFCITGILCEVGTESEGGVEWGRHNVVVGACVCCGKVGGRRRDTKETWEGREGRERREGGEGRGGSGGERRGEVWGRVGGGEGRVREGQEVGKEARERKSGSGGEGRG